MYSIHGYILGITAVCNMLVLYQVEFTATHRFYMNTTVPLNYNFILIRVSTSGATKYFACQMPEFSVEIQISTRRDVAFRRGIYMRRGTWHFTRDGIMTFTRRGCAH